MGREIRMVPPNWEHPKMKKYGYENQFQPMFRRMYEEARAEWLDGLAEHKPEENEGMDYWEWEGNPPNREYYRPWKDEDATWFQVWENVSEGTPVTPPFSTKTELIDYLTQHGDFWDQSSGRGPWSQKAAEAFVGMGYAPTGVISCGKFMSGIDFLAKELA